MIKYFNYSFIYVILIMNFIFSQCEELSQYPCASTMGCEWIPEVQEGSCIDLNQTECQSE